MKADQFGTAAEQTRARIGWRTAVKGEIRCDGCIRSTIEMRTNGGTDKVTCDLVHVSTKPNGTCTSARHVEIVSANATPPSFLEPDKNENDSANQKSISDLKGQHTPIGDVLMTTTDLTTNATGQELMPYDRQQIVGECKFYMGQASEAMLEAGWRLIDLKDNESFGDFTQIIQHELGIEPRTAQRMMLSAKKFMPTRVPSKTTALSFLGKTKLFDLMNQDDGDLEELADGGKLSGMTLDEIDRMTSRELKAALRKAKADAAQETKRLTEELASKDRMIGKKNERINELSDKLDEKHDREVDIDKDALARAHYAKDLAIEALDIRSAIDTSLRGRCKAVLELHQGDHHEHARLLVAQALGQVAHICRLVAIDFDINPNTLPEHAMLEALDGANAEIWRLTNAEMDAKQAKTGE